MNLDPGLNPHSHTNGSAASRTVHMFPALAAPANESAPAEGSPNGERDLPAEVKRVLTAATKPLSLAEIQPELGDEPHVPEGPISAAIEAMGATVAKTFVDEVPHFAMAESAEATMTRARAVLDIIIRQGSTLAQVEKKLSDAGTPYPEAKIVEDLGAWIAAGVVEKRETALEPLYQILEAHCVASDNAALDSLMRVRFPESFVDYEALAKKAETALQEKQATLTETRKALAAERVRLGLYAAWFRANGIADPTASPVAPREVVTWSRQRKVDGKELRRLVDERHKLKAFREALVSKFDAAKAGHKEALEKVDAAISAVEEAERSSSHLLSKQVYKFVEDGKIVVYSAEPHDEGTLLDREDVPTPTAPTSAPPLIPPTDEIAEEAGKVAAAISPPDPAVQAAANAANAQEERAAAVRGKGPKGEITIERMLSEAETLLRAFGSEGLEWGEDGKAATNTLGRTATGQERGKLAGGVAALAKRALESLLSDGKAIRRGDAIIWTTLDSGGSGDEGEGPASGEQ